MAKQSQVSYPIIAAIVAVFVLGFGLLWYLIGDQPEPLDSEAATCTPAVLKAGLGNIEVAFENSSGGFIGTVAANQAFITGVTVFLKTEAAPCVDSPNVRVKFIYTASGISGQRLSPVLPVEFANVPGSSQVGFQTTFSTNWNDLWGQPIQDRLSLTATPYIYLEPNAQPVSTTGRASLTITKEGAPTGGGSGGTGTGTGGTGTGGTGTGGTGTGGTGTGTGGGGTGTGGGGTGTGTGGGTGSSTPISGSALCNSDRFQYDPQTGLCLPKVQGSGIAGQRDAFQLITMVIRIMLTAAGVAAVIFLIIGGYFYITSTGNEEQATRGRRTIVYALIGLVVVLLAFVIVTFIVRIISTGGT